MFSSSFDYWHFFSNFEHCARHKLGSKCSEIGDPSSNPTKFKKFWNFFFNKNTHNLKLLCDFRFFNHIFNNFRPKNGFSDSCAKSTFILTITYLLWYSKFLNSVVKKCPKIMTHYAKPYWANPLGIQTQKLFQTCCNLRESGGSALLNQYSIAALPQQHNKKPEWAMVLVPSIHFINEHFHDQGRRNNFYLGVARIIRKMIFCEFLNFFTQYSPNSRGSPGYPGYPGSDAPAQKSFYLIIDS